MEFLRKLFVQTQQHLTGMTLSQRLAIGSCAGLIAVALLWLMNWAGEPAMVPLLTQAMTAQQLAPIQEQLEAIGVKYKIVGDTILVPAESRLRLQAQLAQRNALPDDISITFDTLIGDSSPWLSMEEQSWRRGVALGNELSRVLREFDGVRDARVFLDKSMKRTFGQPSVAPTASVFVKLTPNKKLDQDRVFALASFVSRSVAGLDVSNVQITDFTTGMSYSVPKDGAGFAFDDLDVRRKKERYFAQQIKGLLNISGLLVAVHAEIDSSSARVTKEEHGKPVPTEERTESLTQQDGSSAQEPGVVSNVTPNAGVAVAGARKMEKTVSETKLHGKTDTILTTIDTPRHGLKSLSASVNIPRSYLVGIFKQQADGKEPTDEQLQSAATTVSTLAKIRRQVNRALGIPEEDDSVVAVDWFHDNASLVFGQLAEAGTSDDMMAYVRQYGSKAALGGLALMSLFMMLMMVRKVSEGPILPGEEPPSTRVRIVRGGKRGGAEQEIVETMDVVGAPVGEAEVSEHLMVAKEVDENTLRTQKVIEQVSELIREDVESSATILQQWARAEKS